MSKIEYVELEHAAVRAETEKAIFVVFPVDSTGFARKAWIPRSMLHPEDCEVGHRGDEGVLIVARWIAEEKELIDD